MERVEQRTHELRDRGFGAHGCRRASTDWHRLARRAGKLIPYWYLIGGRGAQRGSEKTDSCEVRSGETEEQGGGNLGRESREEQETRDRRATAHGRRRLVSQSS
eukprot:750704-Prymnesium_polylepis.1